MENLKLCDLSNGNNRFGTTPLDMLPLAMAYVPMQKYNSAYEQSEALMNGTLFPELNKPFEGAKQKRVRFL